MSADLTPAVRRVLSDINHGLKQALRVERPASNPTMQQLLAWCDRHELDVRAYRVGSQLVFDRALISMIEQTLHELNLAGLQVDLSCLDRTQQADVGESEYKSVGLAPTEARVLVAQANCGAYFPEWVTAPPSQWVMDIDWQSLQLDQYQWIVVVENRDAFYQYFAWHPQRYALPEAALTALVIYRGDGDESKGCKALREAAALAGKRLIYFGDYDTAGLNFALNGGYSHIMLPISAYVFEQANDFAQDSKQIHLAESVNTFALNLASDDPLRALLLHNTQQQKGLRQQGFKGPLQILAINR